MPLALLSVVSALPCACRHQVVSPKDATWEPLSEAIPAVEPNIALKRLEDSQKHWEYCTTHEHGSLNLRQRSTLSPRYSYVRARQLDDGHLRFTIIAVEGGRVVARGLSDVVPGSLRANPWRSLRDIAGVDAPRLSVMARKVRRLHAHTTTAIDVSAASAPAPAPETATAPAPAPETATAPAPRSAPH